VETLLKLKVSPKMSFFNMKKLNLNFVHKFKKMKLEKIALPHCRISSTFRNFHQKNVSFHIEEKNSPPVEVPGRKF